jgi:membrane protein implicated in regulation of membrane protease activity
MLMPLLALLLFVFLPWQQALLLYVPVVIGSLAIARKAMRGQGEPPASGREAMAGEEAVVTSVENGHAGVRYKGETWRAVSDRPLQPGQQVLIKAVEGLTLRVSPQHGNVLSENGGNQK